MAFSARALRWILAVLAAVAMAAACRHSAPKVTSGGDTGPHALGDCHPTPGAPGNSHHVGQYCTKGGGECGGNSSAGACAVDYDSRGGNYCIQIFCNSSSECGEGACCAGDPGGLAKACVPMGCVSDAGVCPK